MRSFQLSLLICLIAGGSLLAKDEFLPAVRIQADDIPIDVGGFRGAAPSFGDFDGDGLKDLLVGEDKLGQLRIYRNVGTNSEPAFHDFEWFRVNGVVAELPGEGIFRPQLVDLNGDGKLDMVTSSEGGMVFWYRRLANQEFADAEWLKLGNGKPLIAGTHASCHVVDWDGDGDNDLIISVRNPLNSLGELLLVINEGTQELMSLASPKPFEVEGGPLGDVFPFAVDWNGDGHLDVLLGTQDGSVLLYENTGVAGEPKLSQGRQLIDASRWGRQPPVKGIVERGMGGALCVTDWDNDGKLDILLGDTQSELIQPESSGAEDQLAEARRESVAILSKYRQMRRLTQQLNQETRPKEKELAQNNRERLAKQLEELSEKISQLEKSIAPRQEYHAYVWLLRSMNAN